MTTTGSPTSSYYSVWECPSCGQVIPFGMSHVCPGAQSFQSILTPYIDQAAIERIASALERIASALESEKVKSIIKSIEDNAEVWKALSEKDNQ